MTNEQFQTHQAEDPHCTCNDCIADHASKLDGYTMTATYSPDDNKLRLYSVTRLDPDTYAKVKAYGFKWAPVQKLFVAPMWTPDRADLLIQLCGEIGDEDTSLVDRAEERADRFADYREARTRDAQSAEQAVHAIADGIPLGQPILIGHHSERRARKDAERIENGMRRAVKMWDTAAYWKSRAAGALSHAKYKEVPAVRARRIKGIEADKRRQLRAIAEAAKWIKAWGGLNKPYRGEELRPGVYAQDGKPCDDVLRMKRALFIANYSHISLRATPERPHGSSLWSELEAGRLTPRAAMMHALRAHGRTIKWAKRWIAHYDFRLTYERAMLDEQGGTALLAPKPKSAKAQLPLCNYRAPEGLDILNMYSRGDIIHYPQVEMTQAEYAKINTDYKGTRVVDYSHRVRTTMASGHKLVCVFLTDSKVHARPAAKEPPQPKNKPVPVRTTTYHREPDPAEAMRASLKAGVQVVSAPQLFPTSKDLARQLIELAGVEPGHRVLEPSAGTGALLDAVRAAFLGMDTGGRIVAVEVNYRLAEQLTVQRNKTLYANDDNFRIINEDFLTLGYDRLGTFDRIVMNPPFEHGSDIKHIEHARRLLKPGGKLAAICANGPRQREKLMNQAEAWIDLPEGSFQGTNVRTAMLLLGRED